jgi:uncharacterized protein (TIGR04222 family)
MPTSTTPRAPLTLLVALTAALIGAQPYQIDRFVTEIDLRKNATMTVLEKLDVTFHEGRRGIIRFIPIILPTGSGFDRSYFIGNVRVTDAQGNPHPIEVTREGANVNIRIGNPDVYHDPGTRVHYAIQYTVENMINWFDSGSDWEKSAELYWNATGHEWDAPILASEVIVRFPEVESVNSLRTRLFRGPYGSRESHQLLGAEGRSSSEALQTTMTLRPDLFAATAMGSLEPGEGLTFVLSLPATAIERPTGLQAARLFLLPNLGFVLPLAILLVFPIIWWRYGKHPYGGPMVVQYDPPDDLSGPEAGTFLDERANQRDVAAGIISLAVKGCLLVLPREEGIIFKRRTADLELTERSPNQPLTKFENELLKLLRKGGDRIDESDLRTHVAPQIEKLKTDLYTGLVERGYYRHSPAFVRSMFAITGGVLVAVLAVLAGIISPTGNMFPSFVGGIFAVILVLLFARAMPQRTSAGARALQRLRGFEEFMRRARGRELQWMTEKHPDQALFEQYLPHAVAFGLTREWAKAFEGIVQEMPQWYVGPRGPGVAFRPTFFGDDMISVSNALGSAASVPPRSSGSSGGSSGFGGGGFSGGGGGGGGGSSW